MRSVRFKPRALDKFAERLRMSACRAQRHSLKLFVVFKYATNRLFVSRVILISPSNPGTPQNACILRGAPFGLSSPVFEMGYRPLTWECC